MPGIFKHGYSFVGDCSNMEIYLAFLSDTTPGQQWHSFLYAYIARTGFELS